MTNNSYLDTYRDIIPDYKMFCESIKLPAPTHIRINTLKADPARVKRDMEKRGIKLKPAGDKKGLFFEISNSISSGNLPEYFMGHIHPQALTSCIASYALSPQKDSLVLDMCASPGGKTSHLSDIMSNTGLVVANELYPTRRIPLAHTLSRLGVMNSIQTGYQAQEFPLRERFDYVLADVPCSGEGRLRANINHDKFRNIRPIKSNKLLELQKKIVIRGFNLLKDNGVMLYATCTYNPGENESVVQYLLDNREAEILPLKCDFTSEKGLSRWRECNYDRKMERTARFYPHRVNSVGFFMARIGRRKR
jgi:NOL1/NOP2/sun family putative RNA methylase